MWQTKFTGAAVMETTVETMVTEKDWKHEVIAD